MSGPILVINPNSTVAVTAGIDRACEPLRMAGGPRIECVTLAEGPAGIQTQRDVDAVVAPLVRLIGELDARAAAFVIACFSDPGLHSAREATAKPVLGIMECGILAALTLGKRFGIIAILPASIPRHRRAIGAMGLADRLAGERAVGLNVVELADEAKTLDRMIAVARELHDQDGADAIVMGCAGMAQYRDRVAQAAGIPVVEPTQAAVAMAIGRVRIGW
ncbi:MAG TPA: aspartate/glutamate racemase family protein [Burkholderiales bacterium]|nr:aspartate/glutamate racemase family protein [Burkholderiales bacterium]